MIRSTDLAPDAASKALLYVELGLEQAVRLSWEVRTVGDLCEGLARMRGTHGESLVQLSRETSWWESRSAYLCLCAGIEASMRRFAPGRAGGGEGRR